MKLARRSPSKMDSRPSEHFILMSIAKTWATRSTCPRARVGAVLVRHGRIISTGYNGAPSNVAHCDEVGCFVDDGDHCIRAVHAEMNTLLQCASQGISSVNSTLYTTHEPCPRCVIALIQAEVHTVWYCNSYGHGIERAYIDEMKLRGTIMIEKF